MSRALDALHMHCPAMLNPVSPVSPATAPMGRKRRHAVTTTEVPSTKPAADINDPSLVRTSCNDAPANDPSFSASAATQSPPTPAIASSSSAFRNVSACHRCRLRKNRCDQRLPRCQLCEKAGVKCVGYDPITKREIPRSYVYFLEVRTDYLERILREHGIDFKDAEALGEDIAVCMKTGSEAVHTDVTPTGLGNELKEKDVSKGDGNIKKENDADGARDDDKEDNWRIHNLVSNIGMVSVQGTSDPRYLGSTSGISFARMVFAAVKSSVSGNVSERGPMRPTERLPHSATGTGTSTMRDSFFGLQTRPTMKCATFPDRELAENLVNLYFEHANPQMPILHRTDFMEMLNRTYAVDEKGRSPRSLYALNIVFAIGAGIIFEDKDSSPDEEREKSPSASKKQKLSSHQHQPEEYHASAIIHLESTLDSSTTSGSFGGLEELQAVLLLASFALLRPVAPGLWYIVGVAIRLAVDLGLHYEDGTGVDYVGEEGVDLPPAQSESKAKVRIDSRERGRREWVRDLRRRLWWCVYSFDRLVGCCVGRPFGISDQAISTEFPSLLEDKYITKSGIVTPPDGAPSYKHAAQHYFRLRVLQSEIQDVLQYQQARLARQRSPQSANVFTRSDLPSPFLQGFDSLRSWRKDMHWRLVDWKESAPSRQDTGVRFPVEFLELNYWQAVIMLYQQCLTVPAELAGELAPAEDVSSPSFSNIDDAEDEDDIYYKVAEAGQKVIRIYRQLHRVRLVNYTYLATHHIFMAGISFLYAIWHSPYVRSRLTSDEVDFTVLAATSVLGDLTHKCPPAEACREAFDRMSKATVQMALSTTGFGSQVDLSQHSRVNARQVAGGLYRGRARYPYPGRYPRGTTGHVPQQQPRRQTLPRQSRPMPRFDMNLGDLFGDGVNVNTGTLEGSTRVPMPPHILRGRGYSELPVPNVAPEQALSAHQRTSSIEPYEDHPFSQPQQYYTSSSQQNADNVTPNTNPNHPHFLAAAAAEHHDNNDIGFDFLGLDNTTGPDGQPLPLGLDGNPDYDVIVPSLGHSVGHSVGIDLGFGMAVDFQHDWSENANYDMLEGYFFGGSGSGSGSGGSGGGGPVDR